MANASDRSLFTPPRALVTLAYAGVHSCLAVNMDFRIRENDGQGFFLTICPWQMPIFGLPSLTLPALIKSFVSVFVRGQCLFLASRR